jgi:hypothetical protein
MNSVFPEICGGTLGEAPAGSVAVIPHHSGPLMALVTDQSIQPELRSIVILNLNHAGHLSVVFHDNWTMRDTCLYYKSSIRFELSNKVDDISTNGMWWRVSGVIVSFQNELFIRATTVDHRGDRFVNVQTGALFTGNTPNFYAAFGVWSIWVRDPLRERTTQLFDFNIHNQSAKQA